MSNFREVQIGLSVVGTALIIPITILNLLGGIVSGIWLGVLGEWGEIIRGIIFILVSGFAISFALMPGLLVAAPAAMAIERGKKIIGIIFASISVFYTIILISVWCIWIMWLFSSSVDKNSLIPLLIWSYGVALAPWMWLAQKDQQGGGNEFSIFTTFFAEISYIIGIIMFIFGATFNAIALTFGIIMFLGAMLQILIVSVGVISSEHKSDRGINL